MGGARRPKHVNAHEWVWIDDYGVRFFTCQDLHDAGVTRYRFPHPLGRAWCCAACHGWEDWLDHPAGLVQHQLPDGSRLICCCCWTFAQSDAWVVKQLNAWRRAVRRTRQQQGKCQRLRSTGAFVLW